MLVRTKQKLLKMYKNPDILKVRVRTENRATDTVRGCSETVRDAQIFFFFYSCEFLKCTQVDMKYVAFTVRGFVDP